MLSTILAFLDDALTGSWPKPGQYAVPCPDGWGPQSVPKSSAVPKTGPILTNAETRTFDFQHGTDKTRDDGAESSLTEYDAGLLQERGQYGNPGLCARLKVEWFAGRSAAESARACGCSESYAKKILGTFGRALENQVQKGASKSCTIENQ